MSETRMRTHQVGVRLLPGEYVAVMEAAKEQGVSPSEILRRGLAVRGHPVRKSAGERFWEKVSKSNGDDGCWLWTSRIDRGGYGKFWFEGRMVSAHRWGYEATIGPIPDDLTLDHLCRVTACVNPAHLEPVTSNENVMRGNAPSAVNKRKTHCKHGHEFTPENTYVAAKGYRHCRACTRQRAAEYAARKAAARPVTVNGDGEAK